MEKAISRIFSIAILFVVGLFVYSSFNHPEPSSALVNDSIPETIAAAAQKGFKPCDNPRCLNYGLKGWSRMNIPGHAPTDIWMNYGAISYSQNHVGHIIDSSSGKGIDVGACPRCNGTGWIEKSKESAHPSTPKSKRKQASKH